MLPARPPAWVLLVALPAAALFVTAVAKRRGRVCLRVRPRLSRPSSHGDTYLEAFALRELLGAAVLLFVSTALVDVAVSGDWSARTLALVLAVGVHLPDAVAAAYVLARVRSFRAPLAEWGWRRGRSHLREVSIGIASILMIWPLCKVRHMFAGQARAVVVSILTMSTVLVTPIVEETLYRGALYRHLRDRLRWLPAVIVSSAVFALMHSAPARPVVYVLGLALALLREWRGSLIAPVAAHAAWNALSIADAGHLFD
jgi:membrane protease YdiL (CAAX protease family)